MQLSIFSFIFTILSLFTLVAQGAPIGYLEQRDVFVPPVLSPTTGDVWKKGSRQTVKWDVSKPPAQITNTKGSLVLRSVERGVLLLDTPLAKDFPIMDGKRTITVPTDLPAGEYQMVVFGDSGNWGKKFNIVD